LALFHRGKHIDAKVIAVTQEGSIVNTSITKSSSDVNYYSKNISELFEPDTKPSFFAPNFILIEGAPGIGKSVLSKEIAYQ